MPSFGLRSQRKLDTCHSDLVKICERVVESLDISILEGSRTLAKQQEYFNAVPPKTTLDGIFKKSKHQVTKEQPLSMAVDAAPYPIDFTGTHKSKARFYMMAGHFFQAAEDLHKEGEITHKLRWGGDWDSDKKFEDQSFDDLPHMELVLIQ